MALSTNDTSPVQRSVNEDAEREGQAQESVPYPQPHDGKHYASEVAVVTDHVITDVTHPLAVQVPEGVGASTVGALTPLSVALRVGTPQEQFDREEKRLADEAAPKDTKADEKQ